MSNYSALFTEKDLAAAAEIVAMSILDATLDATLPAEDDKIDFTPSPEFERKMQALFLKYRRKLKFQKAVRSAAAVLVTALVTFGAWLTVDTDARAAFVTWVREIYEDSVIYRFFDDQQSIELPICGPTELPAGYKLGREQWQNDSYEAIYVSDLDDKEDIVFTYYLWNEDGATHIFSTESELMDRAVEVNGYDGYFHADDLSNILIWVDEEKHLVFELTSTIEYNALMKIAESIKIYE